MKIIGVNGINTHGEGNTDRLLWQLETLGHDILDLRMPKRHWFSARWGAEKDAQRIVDVAEDGDIVIAHSFGCLRTAKAMEALHKEGKHFSAVFLFRPAMEKDYVFGNLADYTEVFCFHSKDDYTVMLGSLLLFHPFGVAGVVGFTDPQVYNMLSEGGHNADFEERLSMNARYINSIIHSSSY